jgi:hypothetical protein
MKQCLFYVEGSVVHHIAGGDDDRPTGIPWLLQNGWRIVSVTTGGTVSSGDVAMTGNAISVGSAYVLMQHDG